MKLCNRKGSLTVEAVLIVPLFLGVILMISFLMKAYLIHEMVQDALNQAAMTVSSVSYPYEMSGLKSVKEASGKQAQETGQRIALEKDNIMKVMEMVYSQKGLSSEQQEEAIKDSKVATVSPMVYLQNAFYGMTGAAIERGENQLAEQLCKGIFNGSLSEGVLESVGGSGDSASEDGPFDFSESVYFDNNDCVELVVKYKLGKVDPFGFIKDIPMENRVLVRVWLGGIAVDDPKGPEERKPFVKTKFDDSASPYAKPETLPDFVVSDEDLKELMEKGGANLLASVFKFWDPEEAKRQASLGKVQILRAHYGRNKYNNESLLSEEQLQYIVQRTSKNHADGSPDLVNGFTEYKAKESVYHKFDNGSYYAHKMVHKESGHEVVVFEFSNGAVKVCDSDESLGTYNYDTGTGFEHLTYDVVTYYVWGNTPEDETTIMERMDKTVESLQTPSDTNNNKANP